MTEDQILQPDYTEAELKQRARIIEHANNAANQKAQSYIELDDMDYETWYGNCKKAAQGYIKPKTNDEDVRVVTGTTREKGNALVNTFLNYNLEADITAYDDQNLEVTQLGEIMEKMVRKSRDLELPDYDCKRALIYQELVYQGNVFIRESWDEYEFENKSIKDPAKLKEGIDPRKIEFTKGLKKYYSHCNSSILTGLELFPGNIREYFMELQPYIIVRKIISRAEAYSMFNKWARYKNVPSQMRLDSDLEHDLEYDDFQMISVDVDLVEVIEYFNKWTNEYQMMLNGVCMLPADFPLSYFLGACEYPIAKGDGEAISPNFFFCRGIAAKTKMDQAILDEMFKMMIVKTRKSYKPPLANHGNYNIGPSVYLPGRIFKGIDPEKLKPIGENTGVTPAEFNMTQFIKQVIDEKTVSPLAQGQEGNKAMTAREAIIQNQRSMIQMGLVMLGLINLEKRMAWLRINNILLHWTEKVDQGVSTFKEGMKAVYRTYSIEGALENGQEGTNLVKFTENLPVPDQVYAEEELYRIAKNKNVRIYYMNPEMLRTNKYIWDINITPTERSSSLLKTAMFEDTLKNMFAMFAPLGKMPNLDYLADRWAILVGEDPEQVWVQQQQQGQMMQGVPAGAVGAAIPQQRSAQLNMGALPRPSVNTLATQ